MATPAVQCFPYQTQVRRPFYLVWLPVFFGLTVICCESTTMMGGGTTGRWLTDIWPKILGQANTPFFGVVHQFLRKLGHFTGYGTLGLFLHRAWYRSIRLYLRMMGGKVMLAASALSVLFTFFVGSLDEWHQSILPGRTSTFHDVLIDTSGALLFNLIFWGVGAYRRRALRTI
jgi:VanZ family protein